MARLRARVAKLLINTQKAVSEIMLLNSKRTVEKRIEQNSVDVEVLEARRSFWMCATCNVGL